MGKVNEARGFKTRKPVFSNYDSRWLFALDTAEKVFHPYRLEFRVFTEDKDEFESYLRLLLVPAFGVSNNRIYSVGYENGYTRFHITIHANDDDLKLINIVLRRLCRGIEDYRTGNLE